MMLVNRLRPLLRQKSVRTLQTCNILRSKIEDSDESHEQSAKVYMKVRRESLKDVKEWYPNHNCRPSHTIPNVLENFQHLEAEESAENEDIRLTGRINTIRKANKDLYFIDLLGNESKLQIKVSSKHFEEEDHFHAVVEILKRGDIISAQGFPTRTKSGELSLAARKLILLAPSLRIMPKSNQKLHRRRRFADFMISQETRNIFRTRATIIHEIRNFLEEHGFLEVETPILDLKFGGAIAKPFKTYHNEMEMDMFLRIAPEIHLKQLLIGGFDRVFEIGKQFRNEGISSNHNPEFTTCEFYMAYADYKDIMSLTGRLLRRIVRRLYGEEMKVPYSMKGRPILIDFKSKFNRLDYFSSIESAVGKQLPSPEEVHFNKNDAFSFLSTLCEEAQLDSRNCDSCGKLLDKLFSHFVEPKLAQPTFVLDFPQCLSPLARPHRSKPFIAERFEFYVAGKELINAYSELNSPDVQRQMFLSQMKSATENEGVLNEVDEDYIEALEHGLPPTGGFGLGIDRLTMVLTNQESIKDVLLFPMLRPLPKDSNDFEDSQDPNKET